MDLNGIEQSFHNDDFNFKDTLENTIRQYDIISYIRANKYFIYLVLDFLNNREIKCISLENLTTGKTSKIILAGYKSRTLIITESMLANPFYGEQFKNIIEKHKQQLPLAEPQIIAKSKEAERYFVICKFYTEDEANKIVDENNIKKYMTPETFQLFEMNKKEKRGIFTLQTFKFTYNFKNQSVNNGLDKLLNSNQFDLNNCYLLTAFGYISLNDIKSLKTKDINFYSFIGLCGITYQIFVNGACIDKMYTCSQNKILTLYRDTYWDYATRAQTYTLKFIPIEEAYYTCKQFLVDIVAITEKGF